MSADRVVCPRHDHATFSWRLCSWTCVSCISSRANLHFGASLPGITAHPIPYLRLGHTPPPFGQRARTLIFAHDDRVSPRRCTPLRIWLDICLHLHRSAAGLLDPSRFLGVRPDVGLLDIIHQ